VGSPGLPSQEEVLIKRKDVPKRLARGELTVEQAVALLRLSRSQVYRLRKA